MKIEWDYKNKETLRLQFDFHVLETFIEKINNVIIDFFNYTLENKDKKIIKIDWIDPHEVEIHNIPIKKKEHKLTLAIFNMIEKEFDHYKYLHNDRPDNLCKVCGDFCHSGEKFCCDSCIEEHKANLENYS